MGFIIGFSRWFGEKAIGAGFARKRGQIYFSSLLGLICVLSMTKK